MAFNPRGFDNIYGFDMLDELHNFFPELLYDDGLFQGEGVRWMRHRLGSLFSDVYVRQQNMYNIYHAGPRLLSYAQWHRNNTHFPPVRATTVPPLSMPPAPRNRNVDISGAFPTTQRRNRIIGNVQLFTPYMVDLRETTESILPNNLLNLFNMAFQDVQVSPSQTELDTASSMILVSDVPEDTSCSICMEREHSEPVWRRLHCGHMYHRPCIDTWLSSHCQCPICRADVRTLRAPDNDAN